jgi:hypothetical protein
MTEDYSLDGGFDPPSSHTGGPVTRNSTTVDSTNDPGQDWAQWMQWDWDDSILNTKSVANEASKSGPALDTMASSDTGTLGDIDKMDFATAVSPSGSIANATLNLDSSLYQTTQQSRLREGGGGKSSMSMSPPFEIQSSTRKRKTTSDDDGSGGMDDDSPPDSKTLPSKKRSHNVIEKRYRANLNEKIAELRDSIPSLRAASKQINGSSPGNDDADGLVAANKLNKASILSKATDYIRHLELRNSRLEEENKALKTRLRQLDKAMDQTATTSVGSASSPSSYAGTADSSLESPPSVFSFVEDSPKARNQSEHTNPLEGLIKVPDYIKKMRATTATQGAFAESYIQDDRKPETASHTRRGMTVGSKLMLGTIAGLMVVQTINTEKNTETNEEGLLAVPLSLLYDNVLPYLRYLHASLTVWNSNVSAMSSWHITAMSNFLLTTLLVFVSAFGVFLYLFNSRPQIQRGSQKFASGAGVKMTPAEFRRQAWLTSMQRVGVPRHRFFLEWFAVTCRWFEYTLGCLLGWRLYSWITGITEDDEKGRVKTWDIAIDAQLAGGDAEVTKSRLVLTIFASGTLPRSPARTMLKALHIRLLLWRVGESGSFVSRVANDVARALAAYQWGLAREMSRSLPEGHPDALPSHLAYLLKIDCDDVMIDSIVQRAFNLTWNRPTQESIDDDEALLDVVVDDPAIQTSMDALAAWLSSHILQRALLQSFKLEADSLSSRAALGRKIRYALNVAPRPSAAHTRALAMKAVLFEQDRIQNIGTVLAALPSEKDKHSTASNFLDSSVPVSVRVEIAIAARCAMIATIIRARATNDDCFPSHLTTRKAITWFNQLSLDPVELTLVGFAAVYHLLHVVTAYGDLLSSSSSSSAATSDSSSSVNSAPPLLETISSTPSADITSTASRKRARSVSNAEPTPQYSRVAGDLMYWARHAYNPAFYGFTQKMVDTVEAECISICKEVGIDVAPARRAESVNSSLHKIMKAERIHRKKNSTGQATENNDRRRSVESNDTGYGSDSEGHTPRATAL